MGRLATERRAHRWRRLVVRAAKSNGYITFEQLCELGFSKNQLAHLVRLGQMEASGRGVYRLPSHEYDWKSQLHHQSVGTRAVVSHLSAAMLFDLARPSDLSPGYAEFIVGKQMRKRLPAVRLYQVGDFDDLPTLLHNGFLITSIDRTLADIGATHHLAVFRRCFNAAVRERLTTQRRFADAVEIDQRRRGRAKLERALAAVNGELVPPSDWSQWAVERLLDLGLPEPQKEVTLRDHSGHRIGRVDLYWPEYRLVIELDGRRFHLDADSFEGDRLRDARLLGMNISVLRFTWRHYADGDYFERTVSDALRQRGYAA